MTEKVNQFYSLTKLMYVKHDIIIYMLHWILPQMSAGTDHDEENLF